MVAVSCFIPVRCAVWRQNRGLAKWMWIRVSRSGESKRVLSTGWPKKVSHRQFFKKSY